MNDLTKQNRSQANLLLHPAFLLALFVLLSNDFYWKYQHNNWLTGKLSDFAGMMVLPVFCRVLSPALSKKFVLLLCALFFIWWKSPLSQPLIHILNERLHWPVQRVVDVTDLVALAVLPLAGRITHRSIQLQPLVAGTLRWALGFVAFFSLCSTSVYRGLFQANPLMDDVYFNESFSVKAPSSHLLETLSAKGIAYRLDSVMYYPITNQDRLYYKTTTTNDSDTAWQALSTKTDSLLYFKWQGAPYYIIPEYRAEDKTLRNIRFTLSENREKTRTTITIQMFQAEGVKSYLAMDNKTKKAYQKIFISIFSAN